MEIDEFNHPDSIWTWKSSKGKRKVTLWLPYFRSVEPIKRGNKNIYRFFFNGGEFDADLRKVESIMIYGATGSLPVSFLDSLSLHNVHLMIHRRNKAQPYVFLPDQGGLTNDHLSSQILVRKNEIKRMHIARSLIKARFTSIQANIPISDSHFRRLAKARDLSAIRVIEAEVARRYWSHYYLQAGVPEATRRDAKFPINKALNAASFFMFGIILRWVALHRLSPSHGFLHEPTTYAALCYDLMEPYRVWLEDAALRAQEQGGDEKELVSLTINFLKAELESEVAVPLTRQIVSRKNLLHGEVLALINYLEGEVSRFSIPMEGYKRAGRPQKNGLRIPGERLKVGW